MAARKRQSAEPDVTLVDDELAALQRVLDGSTLQAGDVRKAIRRLHNDVRYLIANIDGGGAS